MSKHAGYSPGVTDQSPQRQPYCCPDEHRCYYDVGERTLRRTRDCLKDRAAGVRAADEDSTMTFPHEMAVFASREAATGTAEGRIVKKSGYVPDCARGLLAEATSKPLHPLVAFGTWDDPHVPI